MNRRTSIAALVLLGSLIVGACSSGSSDTNTPATTGTSTTSSESADTTVAGGAGEGTDVTTAPETTTRTVAEEPAIAGVDLIELSTPTSGGGTRPLLEWAAVDGAALYFVNIYTETGGPYWSAVTAETSTCVGGPLQVPAGRTGPNVADGYTWVVYAEDADRTLLAVSAQRPIAP